MRRREFIALGAGAAVLPVVASAQQPKVITIGVLVHSAPGWQRFWQVFPAALSERGLVEGRNIRFEFRSDEGGLSRPPELAAGLVGLKVDVVWAHISDARNGPGVRLTTTLCTRQQIPQKADRVAAAQ
jgi:putative ABC transport system substrate-binding protein